MSDSQYDLVIQHHASVEPVDRLVRDLLILLDKEGDPYIEYKLSEGLLFPESKTAILENISQDEAEYYQKRFREMSVETLLRPTVQLAIEKVEPDPTNPNDMHTCPACKHQQPRSRSGMNTCQNCNLVAEKYQRHQKREDIIAQESRVYKFQQEKLMREALERARLDQEEQVRREARLQLSLESKKRPLDIAIGVTAISLMVLAGILIVTTIQRKETQSIVDAQHQALMAKELQALMKPNKVIAVDNKAESTPSLVKTTPVEVVVEKPDPVEADTETPNLLTALSPTANLTITQADIDKLKGLLELDSANPYFSKISSEQFKVDRQKLARLMELNKPELAVAFVNELNDHYAASLLLLDIAQAEIKQNHRTNDADILRTFNTLLSRAPAIQQPLVSASFSLMYRLQGQDSSAQSTLAPTIADLKSTENDLLFIAENKPSSSAQTQKLGIILQIIKDYHRFAQQAAANEFIVVAEEIVTATSSAPLEQAEAMTLMASACVVLGDQAQASAWLNKITDTSTREQLLEKLHSL
ncbi:MAG: hypothetical protein WBP46_04915 [Thiolinea sp.]